MNKVVLALMLIALVPCVVRGQMLPITPPSDTDPDSASDSDSDSDSASANSDSASANSDSASDSDSDSDSASASGAGPKLPWFDIPALDGGMVGLCSCLRAEDREDIMEDIYEIFEDIVELITDIKSGELSGCHDIVDAIGEIAEDLVELVVEDLGLPLPEDAEDGVEDFFDIVKHVLCDLGGPLPSITDPADFPAIPVAVPIAGSGTYKEASVFVTKNGDFNVVYGKIDTNASAYGYFKDELNETGWGVLEVKAGYGSHVTDADLMYAAGILEGALTAKHIGTHYENLYNYFFSSFKPETIQKLKDFFTQQQKWSLNMQTKLSKTDAFWRHASYVTAQMNGLYAGFKYAANSSVVKPDMFVIQVLNAAGDLLDLRSALGDMRMREFDDMSREELLQYVSLMGQCSALVKVTGAFEKLFMSHSSWFIYSATNRIYKHYHFNLADPASAARSLSFSSYPGFLESLDDFYLLSSDLVVLQTTNNIFNTSLYQHVTPESMLAWQRVRIANSLAHSGREWYDTLKRYNSGTYNNQYMIIDLSKVHLGSHIDDDALWVVEQVPTLVVGADQTPILRAGYWPSYNVPFYEAIYNLSGYPQFVAQHGTDFSYQLAPRAKIFRRDQAAVTDMATMQHIMRYNDYQHDPYSDDQPCNAICCRGDLSQTNPAASGCYDTKVTDFSLAQSRAAFAINGPTLGDSLPAFAWRGVFANMSHAGLPESYTFGWHYMQPAL